MKTKYYQHGLAAIELTLIVPFLLLLIFATAEFGRMLYQYNALNHLTRDALRYAIHDVVDGDSVVSLTAVNEMLPITQKLLKYGDGFSAQEILPNLSTSTISLTAVEHPAGSGVLKYVTISVSYVWQPVLFTSLPSFVSSNSTSLSFPLVVNYTMRAL